MGAAFPTGWTRTAERILVGMWPQIKRMKGSFSIKAGSITDSQSASISYTGEFVAGNIEFYVKVSSESSYDEFSFYLDGVAVDLNGLSSGLALSGEINWQQVLIPMTQGVHTITMEYSKDSSVSDGSDTVWVDNLVLPVNLDTNPRIIQPAASESLTLGGTYSIIWAGITEDNLQVDLLQDGEVVATLGSALTNVQTIEWNVDTGLPTDAVYTLRISDLSNSTLVTFEDFYLQDEIFAADGLFPVGWNQASGADQGWGISVIEAYEGIYSISNNDISHSESAGIEYTGDFATGDISFYVKLSSESNFDFFEFSIDGVKQDLDSTTARTGLSGNLDWSEIRIPVDAGTHTLKLEYTKDGSVDRFSDSVWVDQLILPLSTTLTALEYYSLWSDSYGGLLNQLADEDSDGFPNLFEYATGTNPNVKETNAVSVADTIENNVEYVSLSIPQRKDAADRGIVYSVETSTDLNVWTSSNISVLSTVSQDSEFDLVTYRVTTPKSQSEKMFIKVNINLTD